jgi:integrase/recombinase XerD
MTALREAAADYLALRRSVGFKLVEAGRMLPNFVAFSEANGETLITVTGAMAWATQASTPNGAARRIIVVRGFATYLQAIHPDSEIPPAGMVPNRKRRLTPYLYSERDIAAMMAAARRLEPPLWALTTETLIGLLHCTGMRIGEALRLDRCDVAFDDGVLTVGRSKVAKSRLVPVDPTTVAALANYDRARRQLCGGRSPAFFVSIGGTRLGYHAFRDEFGRLLVSAGVPSRPTARRPRIHDLRHSFAVRTLVGWYRDGLDVQALLPRLSTYLGHVDPASTYWYLSAAPELLAFAVERLELGWERPS